MGLYTFVPMLIIFPSLRQVFVQGLQNLNRAVNDDNVVLEMLPEEEWSCPSSMVMREDEAMDEEDEASRAITDTVCSRMCRNSSHYMCCIH